MKYFITTFVLVLIIGCKKTEEPKQQSGQPAHDTTTHIQPRSPQMEEAFQHLDRQKMKSPDGALDIFVNLPPGGPIPPHLLPAQNIKRIGKTDSTVTYSFVSGTTKTDVKVTLKKIYVDRDTLWDVMLVQ
ncbi:MAG: hypothetical protein Q8916_06410 [Bacteroidota bacterium]|nr:hypothetical protein [Bacteroidota bacterium]MDP4230023.1 hypothetical protein [Bacteroidota bacterium]MDP4234832.1 hypothetical protein [Bacteroidota bacterium]